MHSEGLVEGKASLIDHISQPPLIFTKMRNLASFSKLFNFEPSAFENTASYLTLKQIW